MNSLNEGKPSPLRGALRLCTLLLLVTGVSILTAAESAPARLRISESGRFLITPEGHPFFWLGDTAWEIFHRLDREEAITYLDSRQRAGYTVIQVVALAQLDGLNEPNVYGHRPLLNLDPTQPDTRPGEANDYWDHVDFIIDQANRRGLVVALLPSWGDKWLIDRRRGVGPLVFTEENARVYGRWIGERYRDKSIVWVVGGDRPVEDDRARAILRAMAQGLKDGDQGRHLMSFHPVGRSSSSQWWPPDEPWLDFRMIQSGHMATTTNFKFVEADYGLRPVKPVIDVESAYEYPPGVFPASRPVGAREIRRNAYWAVFAGAFGHTYGAHSVWQMYDDGKSPGAAHKKREPLWGVVTPWHESLTLPGALQLEHLKRLILSRPFLSRIPDQSVLVSPRTDDLTRIQVTRDGLQGRSDATYIMAYFPGPATATFDLTALTGRSLRPSWFNPRNGESRLLPNVAWSSRMTFTTPATDADGNAADWILVIDDADRNYPPPGAPLVSTARN